MTYVKYLLIPYKHCGRGWGGGDCLNLLRLFYSEELGIELDDHSGYDEHWYRTKNLMLDFVEPMGFIEVAAPEYGDLILLTKRGRVCHCGVFIDTEYFIHTSRSGTAVHSRFALFGGLEVHGVYRHKERIDVN